MRNTTMMIVNAALVLVLLIVNDSASAFTTSNISSRQHAPLSTRQQERSWGRAVSVRPAQASSTSLNLFDFFSKEAREKREAEKQKRLEEQEEQIRRMQERRRNPELMEEYFDQVIETRKKLNEEIESQSKESREKGI